MATKHAWKANKAQQGNVTMGGVENAEAAQNALAPSPVEDQESIERLRRSVAEGRQQHLAEINAKNAFIQGLQQEILRLQNSAAQPKPPVPPQEQHNSSSRFNAGAPMFTPQAAAPGKKPQNGGSDPNAEAPLPSSSSRLKQR
ncbi:uncharacterized protein ALTATR162_LOCUS7406 [Alternaria atra]|uniref:Uncharacterized protein n=1 Tax=Alternaria atra TaxID=119953 RepID=A0A8J2I387_9PLEO|nr:uncharacterized protein ALTATR162_LOCUS7406 [Alternaria atra]CAG5171985.1 unnamed protein product [Alternaria atra]